MKILTLNTWQERGAWEERWQVIFEGVLKVKPDIIGLQEVFNADWAQEVTKRLGFSQLVFPSDPSGLMILSHFPVITWKSIKMKTKSPAEDYGRYGLFAKLRVGKKELTVWNTHLSWMLDEGGIREQQIGELLTFMQREASGRETVAMGDFNAPSGTTEIKKMTQEGSFTDAFASLHPNDPGLTWDNQNPYAGSSSHPLPDRRIDYIFIHQSSRLLKHLEAVDILFTQPDRNSIFASDHYGVLATFK